MHTRHYRMVGAFELLLRPRGQGTLIPIDLDALLYWGTSLIHRADFELHAAVATDEWLMLVATTESPRSVPQLARWAPSLVARPLHTTEEYALALSSIWRLQIDGFPGSRNR